MKTKYEIEIIGVGCRSQFATTHKLRHAQQIANMLIKSGSYVEITRVTLTRKLIEAAN